MFHDLVFHGFIVRKLLSAWNSSKNNPTLNCIQWEPTSQNTLKLFVALFFLKQQKMFLSLFFFLKQSVFFLGKVSQKPGGVSKT